MGNEDKKIYGVKSWPSDSRGPDSDRTAYPSTQEPTARQWIEKYKWGFHVTGSENRGQVVFLRSCKESGPETTAFVRKEVVRDKRDCIWKFRSPIPPELRFSKLTNRYVDVKLPDEPYFPDLYYYKRKANTRRRKHWFLYGKFYNGGELQDLKEWYAGQRKPIPESFIWHVVEQICRALAYLHFGRTREQVDRMVADSGVKIEDDTSWDSILHRDVACRNILLNYPTKGGDNANYASFPEVVLADFGEANRASDPQKWWQDKAGAIDWEDYGGIGTWEDRMQAGQVFLELCYAQQDGVPDNPNMKEELKDVYSDQLFQALAPFQWDGGMSGTEESMDSSMPTSQWMADVLLPVAARHVQRLREEHEAPPVQGSKDKKYKEPGMQKEARLEYEEAKKYLKIIPGTRRLIKWTGPDSTDGKLCDESDSDSKESVGTLNISSEFDYSDSDEGGDDGGGGGGGGGGDDDDEDDDNGGSDEGGGDDSEMEDSDVEMSDVYDGGDDRGEEEKDGRGSTEPKGVEYWAMGRWTWGDNGGQIASQPMKLRTKPGIGGNILGRLPPETKKSSETIKRRGKRRENQGWIAGRQRKKPAKSRKRPAGADSQLGAESKKAKVGPTQQKNTGVATPRSKKTKDDPARPAQQPGEPPANNFFGAGRVQLQRNESHSSRGPDRRLVGGLSVATAGNIVVI